MNNISEVTLSEIQHCIRQCMLGVDDFSITLVEQGNGQLSIDISYLPSGISRCYRQGSDSQFPVDFCFDLAAGFFVSK